MIVRKESVLFYLLLFFLCALVLPLHAQSSFAKKSATPPAGQALAWGKTLAGGPVKILLVAPRDGLQDAAELSQRLDVECRTVPLWDAEHAGYDPLVHGDLAGVDTEAEVYARLEKELRQSFDVVILANFNIAVLPEKILSLLLEKTARGTGLVVAFDRSPADSPLSVLFETLQPVEDLEFVWRGVSECAFPGGLEARQIIRGYTHEKGMILCLDYPGDFPGRSCLIQSPTDPYDLEDSWRENAWSLVARVICAAAGRRPEIRILSVEDGAPSGPHEDEIPPDFFPEFVQAMKDSAVAQPSRPFAIRLNEAADKRYTVELQLRRPESDTRITYEDRSAFSKGSDTHMMEIPAGPGPCLLDLWLKDRRGVVDWFTTLVQLPGWPDFYQLELEKQWLMPNDSLDVTARIRPYANQSREACLHVRATDGFQRVVAQSTAAVRSEGGPVSTRLHFTDLLSPLIRLEVYALEGSPRSFSETELHSAFREVRYLSVRQRPSCPQMTLGAFMDAPAEYADLENLEQLAEAGVLSIHAPASEAALIRISERGLELLPELERITVEKALDGKYRIPCLNDPSYRLTLEESLKTKTIRFWAGSRARYSLGNGNLLCATEEEVCHCGYCLESWHTSLQQNYEELEFLNSQWNTNFSDWEQIDHLSLSQDMPSSSLAAHRAFRSFMDNNFSAFHQWLREVVRAVDGSASVGARFHKDDNLSRGYYWPSLCAALDFTIVDYEPLILEKLASYTKASQWNGLVLYSPDPHESPTFLQQAPWLALARQIPVLWLDQSRASVDKPLSRSWLDSQGQSSRALQTLSQSLDKIQEGLAPLILSAEKERSSIAIYDSHGSRHLSKSSRAYSADLLDSQRALVAALRKNNLPFTFIDREALGRPPETSFRVLILPFCLVLDDEEVEQLFSFVARGGSLVADVMPGLFNGFGKKREENPFSVLFGLEKHSTVDLNTGLLVIPENVQGRASLESGMVEVDASVVPERAVPLARAADIPLWLVSRWEDGNTLLLNHPFRSLTPDTSAEMTMLRDFIGNEGAPHEGPEKVDPDFQGMIHVFHYGRAKIFLILADPEASRQSFPLSFHKKDVVYLPLEGMRLLQPHRPRRRMEGGESVAVVWLPEDLKGFKIFATDKAMGGQRLTVQIKDETAKENAGKSLLLLDLLGPDQKAIPCYRQLVVLEKALAETFFPLALNQMPGQYLIRARNLLTGQELTQAVKIISMVE
ncbi:MAG: hypothetical protein GX130_08400 [Candidatus Hydrogenedens sp.]|nr:hypothetical protein [Candidatus Hydrogenedens sp.]